MTGYLLCLLLGCLWTSSLSQFVFSTFDNRYPSQITEDSRVKCSAKGSFPHPANCTWFYRCVDRIDSGIFQVFFFKCEPGTVFSDALDQCVFGSSNLCDGAQPITAGPGIVTVGQITTPGPGTGVQPTIPGPGPGTDVQPPIPGPGTGVQPTIPGPGPGTGVQPPIPGPGTDVQPPIPGPGTVVQPPIPGPGTGVQPPIPGPGTGVQPPIPGPGTDVQPPIPGSGTDVQPPIPGPGTGVQPPIPGPGTGAQPTIPGQTIQPPTPPATISVTPGTPSTITVKPPSPPPITTASVGSQSTIQCRNCVTRTGCKVGQMPFLVQLCDSCMFGNSGVYLTPKEECPYHPDPYLTSEGRCFSGLDLCPETRNSQQLQKPQEDEPLYTIRCSEIKPRPDDQKIRELYCSDYHFCSPFGNYEGSQQLCSNFLQCYQNEYGYWDAELRNCLASNLYSFDFDRCLPYPDETRLCRRL